ncbi:hypothetical protein QOZ80_4AG0314190 [Eleusine coracana subsp. coracana]|nr:hypothetical protein QOZ80_4AG0314190 [Eleusine coracana subsp. coracana]
MEEAAARERKRPREDDAAPPPRAAAAAGEAQYVYLPIVDAIKAPGAKVCLFAAVDEIGATVRSRGTDFTLTLRIVDQSRAAGISVTFFADNTALLPCVRSSGDVISLHNVMIRMHGEFFVTFDKKFSSFALFEGKGSTECRPYQTSMKYHGSKHDSDLLTQTRMWLANHPSGLKDLELQLRSIKSDSTFDLVCKVLHVREASNGKWIFYVWDGTDTPATEFQDCRLSLSPATEFQDFWTLKWLNLPLYVSKKCLHPGRFCNITCKQEFGVWKGVLLPSSRVRLLSNKDGSVVDRLKMYDSRLANKVQRRPMTSLPEASNVAGTEYETAGYTTLMESLTHEQVTHKFKTLVRVVAAFPCRTDDLRSLLTGNFCLRLTLEDPTARIHAYIHKDDGAKFFGGFLTGESLIKKMNKLLGIPEDGEEGAPLTRNPPWIWCCLKSYYLDKNDPWGSRRYRIFATEIRD